MKKILAIGRALLFSVALVSLTAYCHKNGNSVPDSGCITRVTIPVNQTPLNNAQLDSIALLFMKNGLSANGLQFTSFIGDIYTDKTVSPQSQAGANLYVNGLPVFDYEEVFTFNNGIFDTAYLYTALPANNDTSGHQYLSSLRSAFFQHLQESVILGGPANAKPFIPSASAYRDSCLQAELGYVDAGSIPGNNPASGKSLVKIWKVTVLGKGYPVVFVKDDNGLAWGAPLIEP